MNTNKAKKLATEYLHNKHKNNYIVLEQELPKSAYDINPENWITFVVHKKDELRIGGDEFVAVNLLSSEVRYLGILGE